jgi:uncharacterized protein (TIGR02265 family)
MVKTEVKSVPQSLVRDLIIGNELDKNANALQDLKARFNFNFANPPENIPIETYIAIINYVRQLFYSDLPDSEAYFGIAIASLEGHFQGTVGKINKIAARMLGIEKAAQLYLKTQKINYPFGTHEIEKIEKGYFRYRRIGVAVPPAFTKGTLTHLVKLTGGRDVAVSYRVLAPHDIIFEASWS